MVRHPDSSPHSSLPHDLGGRLGYAAVPVDHNDVFSQEWERRSFGVSQFAQGLSGFNTDGFRHGLEREQADLYLELDYWHRWILNAERMLVEGGVLGSGAVTDRILQRRNRAEPQRTTDCMAHGERGNVRPKSTEAQYRAGDLVRAVGDPTSQGHTRIPGYVIGKVGSIVGDQGVWVYPDTHAHGQGEHPQWVYSVAFDAQTLWGSDAGTHRVCVDLFEPYLEAP